MFDLASPIGSIRWGEGGRGREKIVLISISEPILNMRCSPHVVRGISFTPYLNYLQPQVLPDGSVCWMFATGEA